MIISSLLTPQSSVLTLSTLHSTNAEHVANIAAARRVQRGRQAREIISRRACEHSKGLPPRGRGGAYGTAPACTGVRARGAPRGAAAAARRGGRGGVEQTRHTPSKTPGSAPARCRSAAASSGPRDDLCAVPQGAGAAQSESRCGVATAAQLGRGGRSAGSRGTHKGDGARRTQGLSARCHLLRGGLRFRS